MNRLTSVMAGTVVAALLASGAVQAQGPRAGGPGGPGRGGRDGGGLPLRGLNLTDAQQQQIRDIRQQDADGARELRDRLLAAQNAQRDAIERVPVNEGLIRQTTQALADVEAEAAIRRAHVFSQVWNVLTKEQQAQVTARRVERESRQADRQVRRGERKR